MKRKIYKAVLFTVMLLCSVHSIKAQNQVYWREGFQPESGCDLTSTAPTAQVSYYFNGSAGVWYGNNVYRTTGTGCAAFGLAHVRYRNIAGVTDSGYLVTPIVDFGIQEFHFYRSRAGRQFSIWLTADTLATTTNWTMAAALPAFTGTVLCTDTTIIIASATAKRLKIVGRPLTDSDVDSFWVTSFAALPIPVNLLSFNANFSGQKVNLNWNTTNEINSKHFEIERSTNGMDYSSIGITAAKNYAGDNNYAFADMQPLSGASFYRLKMVDRDGKFKYSNVISLNTKIKSGLSVYPNPAVGSITINHGKLNDGAVISIVAADGKLIISNKIVLGAVQTTIDVSKLTRGTYRVIAGDATDKNSIGFMKQ